MFLRGRAADKRLRRVHGSREDRDEKTDCDKPYYARDVCHQRKETCGHQVCAQQHDTPPEAVGERPPDRGRNAEAELSAEVEGGNPEPAFAVVHDAEDIAHVERDERNDGAESGKRKDLREPDKEEIPFPVYHVGSFRFGVKVKSPARGRA